MEFRHYSVMYREVLEYLVPAHLDGTMVDATTGEGGHTRLFLEKYPKLKVIGLDRDEGIQQKAKERLKEFSPRFTPVLTWFDEYFKTAGDESVDLVLFDLGISTYHYRESGRGFSFSTDEPLDMRLDEKASFDASYIVNNYSEEDLSNLIYQYGEERYSRRISRAIVKKREEKRIEKASELEDIIFHAVPDSYRHGRISPATRTFQALRIAVNGELDRIKPALLDAIRALKTNGRMGVITFHSLEDRIVKWTLKEREKDVRDIKILTKKPVRPTAEEESENPPSRSAKLRVVEKIEKEVNI